MNNYALCPVVSSHVAYLNRSQIDNLGFKSVGDDVLISDTALFYGNKDIEIGDNSRIDDFVVVSGSVKFGKHVHIALRCSILASTCEIRFGDFSGLSPHCLVIASFDDYSGESLTNPTIPAIYKRTTSANVRINRHVIVGAGSVIGPGVTLGEGAAVGALSLVVSNVKEWTIVGGVPTREIKPRGRTLLEKERRFLQSNES